MVLDSERRYMGQTARFQETLRRLAMIDEGFVEDQAGLRFGLAGTSALDPRIAALLQVAVSVAIGSPMARCAAWGSWHFVVVRARRPPCRPGTVGR